MVPRAPQPRHPIAARPAIAARPGAVRGRLALVLALLAPLGVACAGESLGPGVTPPGYLAPGLHEITLAVDAVERVYLVDIPEAATGSAPLPVVLAFHGGGGHARQFRSSNGLLEVASREGFILVHPQGTGILRSRPDAGATWNAGFCCGRAAEVGSDDVAFVEALLDDLARSAPVAADRVYATGHSNGGMIAFRLATEIPERFAAVATVGGARRAEDVPPRGPIPLLHMHSVDDPRALYHGGLGPPFPGTDHRIVHPSVEVVLGEWLDRNGCEGDPVVVETRLGPAGTLGAGHRAERLQWQDCDPEAPVEHWRLHGPGHAWPGDAVRPVQQMLGGPATDVISAAEEAWRFFSGRRRGS